MARVWAVAGCDGDAFGGEMIDGDGDGEGETSGDGDAVAGGVAGSGATDSTVTGDSVAAEAFCG